MELLRTGVLDGRTVLFAGEGAVQAREACAALGAATPAVASDPQDEDAVAAELAQAAPDTLVCATGELDGSFIVARTVAASWIEAGRGGKIVLVAPAGDAPAQAALENLARTLSVEWARFDIRPTAILPGGAATAGELAELVAFLASPAGDYYSGCAFTLGAVAVA